MRLFTAVDLPEDILLRLERLLTALRPEALLHWSPIDNLHVTTKFIGEWPAERLDEVHAALVKIPPPRAFSMRVHDMGWFPNEHRPSVLWCGIDGGRDLLQLAEATEAGLVPLGIAREARAYSPHLTLARIKEPVPLDRLRHKIEEAKPLDLGTVTVTRFYLYQSQTGSNASRYSKLREYALAPAASAGKV